MIFDCILCDIFRSLLVSSDVSGFISRRMILGGGKALEIFVRAPGERGHGSLGAIADAAQKGIGEGTCTGVREGEEEGYI